MTAAAIDDIVIIGGGLTGLACGLALARAGHAVSILDRNPAAAEPEAVRTTTINRNSHALLENLGLLTADFRSQLVPVTHIVIDDHIGRHGGGRAGGDDTRNTSSRKPGGTASSPLLTWKADPSCDAGPLAYVVRNAALQAALEAAVAAEPGCHWQRGTAVETLLDPDPEYGDAGIGLQLADGSICHTRLVVAADGAGSPLRRQAGIRTISRRPGQTAIVADVISALPHRSAARQVFLRGGPLALMPLAEAHRHALVWSLPDDDAARLMAEDEAVFSAALNKASVAGLGRLQLASQRFCWPLRQHHALPPYARRLALVGDAAHSIHPLAGQGYNLALADAAGLAAAVSWGRHHGLDAGTAAVLRRYGRGRAAEVAVMTAATDGLNWLFSAAPPSLSRGASIAMALLDRSPVKALALKIAEGGLSRGWPAA